MSDKTIRYTAIAIVASWAVLCLSVLLTSCHSESRISKRALRDMAKAEQRYNNRSDIDTVGAHYCNTMHPVKIGKGVVIHTTDTVVSHDTTTDVRVYMDTVYLTKVITKTVHIHDTLHRVDTFENTRTQELQAGEINGLKAALVKSDKDKIKLTTSIEIERIRGNKYRNWLIIALLIIVAYIIIKSPKLKVFEWRNSI